jgi:hypothetical protein
MKFIRIDASTCAPVFPGTFRGDLTMAVIGQIYVDRALALKLGGAMPLFWSAMAHTERWLIRWAERT